MKTKILIVAFALCVNVNGLFAASHNLRDLGLVPSLTKVYQSAENPDKLAPIIKTYYNRINKGQYDISITDLQQLYDEISNILGNNNQMQI